MEKTVYRAIVFIYLQFKKFLIRNFKRCSIYFVLKKNIPLSNFYGIDRGKPVDRYYIEKFLQANAYHIRGRCLELLNNDYVFGFSKNKKIISDVLDIDKSNKQANIVGDLRNLSTVFDNTYDCIILTQVLQFIDNYNAAIAECYRILKPGGALLATVPALSRIDCVAGVEGDFWRFTKAGAQHAFQQVFESNKLEVQAWGNVKTGLAFWVGMAQEDLKTNDFTYNDPNFPCLITVKAIK